MKLCIGTLILFHCCLVFCLLFKAGGVLHQANWFPTVGCPPTPGNALVVLWLLWFQTVPYHLCLGMHPSTFLSIACHPLRIGCVPPSSTSPPCISSHQSLPWRPHPAAGVRKTQLPCLSARHTCTSQSASLLSPPQQWAWCQVCRPPWPCLGQLGCLLPRTFTLM